MSIIYVLIVACFSQDFRDPTLAIDDRIELLLSQLTLDEKLGQMEDKNPAIERLNIPQYNWVNEILHGVVQNLDEDPDIRVTAYPQVIGMAATFDTAAVEKQGEYASSEARAIYNYTVSKGHGTLRYEGITCWAPNINILRDPRWGRGQETYGECPFLTGQLGMAYVRGLQGPNPNYLKVAAAAKHLAVHSGPEKDRHKFDAVVEKYDLWDTYLPAFRDLIVDAHVAGVMCAYSDAFGQPACANDLLERDVLRGSFNYSGYVTSDCDAIADFTNPDGHNIHETEEQASSDAVLHGTDMECGWSVENIYHDYLPSAIEKGLITEAQIDVSVRRILRTKFLLGMFDATQDTNPYSNLTIDILESPAFGDHALLMARESIVLLENKKNALPISPAGEPKKIALVGPNANNANVLYGNYHGVSSNPVTVVAGLRAKYGEENVYLEDCCNYLNYTDEPLDDVADRVVANGDIIIFAGGLSADLEGEEGDGQGNPDWIDNGDRVKIDFPTVQEDLLNKIRTRAPEKKIILVVLSGSALAMGWERDNLDAIIQAWYPGQAGGTAIADVISGDYNPAGRLPLTVYAKTTDLPEFVDYDMKNRTYRYYTGTPLYKFGYGLSYTTFSYGNITITPDGTIPEGASLTVTFNITNTGLVDGDEVAQLYVSHPQYDGRKPIRSLGGFTRVTVPRGATRTAIITVNPRSLSLVNEENGESFQDTSPVIWVGGHQPTDDEEAASSVTLSIELKKEDKKDKFKLSESLLIVIIAASAAVVVAVIALVIVIILWRTQRACWGKGRKGDAMEKAGLYQRAD